MIHQRERISPECRQKKQRRCRRVIWSTLYLEIRQENIYGRWPASYDCTWGLYIKTNHLSVRKTLRYLRSTADILFFIKSGRRNQLKVVVHGKWSGKPENNWKGQEWRYDNTWRCHGFGKEYDTKQRCSMIDKSWVNCPTWQTWTHVKFPTCFRGIAWTTVINWHITRQWKIYGIGQNRSSKIFYTAQACWRTPKRHFWDASRRTNSYFCR